MMNIDEVLRVSRFTQTKLADLIGVSRQAMREWSKIPAERVLSIEEITGIGRERLRSDLYPTIPVMTLDLPAPPSVNATRRVNWAFAKKHKRWLSDADVMALGQRPKAKIEGPFSAHIILSESHTSIDLDNGIKCLIDYAVRCELVKDDGKKYLRKLTVEWGYAPEGARLILRPYTGDNGSER